MLGAVFLDSDIIYLEGNTGKSDSDTVSFKKEGLYKGWGRCLQFVNLVV